MDAPPGERPIEHDEVSARQRWRAARRLAQEPGREGSGPFVRWLGANESVDVIAIHELPSSDAAELQASLATAPMRRWPGQAG